MGAKMATPICFSPATPRRSSRSCAPPGVTHVILRANGFMQNVLRQRAAIETGNFVEPSGATAARRIDVHDLADVAVAVASGRFDGRALTLTGPASLTGDQMAATLSGVLGRPVRYISPPLPQFRAAMVERGLPAWQIDAFVELQEAVLDGRAPHLAVARRTWKLPPDGRRGHSRSSPSANRPVEIEHDPEKWRPVFRKDHAPLKGRSANRFNLKRLALWRPLTGRALSCHVPGFSQKTRKRLQFQWPFNATMPPRRRPAGRKSGKSAASSPRRTTTSARNTTCSRCSPIRPGASIWATCATTRWAT